MNYWWRQNILIEFLSPFFQPIKNYNPWAFLYFFSFLLIAGFVVINMVVGVIIDNFHRCRDQIEASCGIQAHSQTNAEHIVDGKYMFLVHLQAIIQCHFLLSYSKTPSSLETPVIPFGMMCLLCKNVVFAEIWLHNEILSEFITSFWINEYSYWAFEFNMNACRPKMGI